MNERDALVRAICDNPDDDTPRLVFADWLQEHGEEARAEFVRVQVRFAELLRHGVPDADGLGARARELWQKHKGAWLAEMPSIKGLKWHDAFFRGFVEYATIASDAELVQHADAVFGQPIRQLVVKKFKGVPGFSAIPGLSRLKVLTLVSASTGANEVDELLRWDGLSESAVLCCHFNFARAGSKDERRLQAKFGSRYRVLTDAPTNV